MGSSSRNSAKKYTHIRVHLILISQLDKEKTKHHAKSFDKYIRDLLKEKKEGPSKWV
jgi:hypothetical protein